MTQKRDLKRRIRDRQTRTGEAYTTARTRVLAAAPGSSPIPYVEMLDLSEDGNRLGLTCQLAMEPALAELVAPDVVIERLHAVLIRTLADPAMRLWNAATLRGEMPAGKSRLRDHVGRRRFRDRVIAGLGGVSDDGLMLGLHVPGNGGVVAVLATLLLYPYPWRRTPRVLLTIPGSGWEAPWSLP